MFYNQCDVIFECFEACDIINYFFSYKCDAIYIFFEAFDVINDFFSYKCDVIYELSLQFSSNPDGRIPPSRPDFSRQSRVFPEASI